MTTNNNSLAKLDNVGVFRNGRWLVRGVSLEVLRGQIVTLIGPNGSGKSTTAKIALGLLEADEGVTSTSSNLRIGYVPQKLAIDWTLPLSVRRFMTLTNSLSQNEIAEALTTTGVEHVVDAEITKLSGGEFQRVLLARAIARKPQLLVLDEPVQGVDYAGEIALYELIAKVRDTLNCGILLISHDLHRVMAATDHVLCLNGHVCCSGPPKAIVQDAAYKELFGDYVTPVMAHYNHQHDHTHLPDGRVQHADGSITDHCHPDDGHHHLSEETSDAR